MNTLTGVIFLVKNIIYIYMHLLFINRRQFSKTNLNQMSTDKPTKHSLCVVWG